MIEIRGRLSEPHDADSHDREGRPPEGVARDGGVEDAARRLSYGQRALWFLHQLAPESAAYNVFFAMRVLSELDSAALRRAFQLLIERHPALRTTYVAAADGNPLQVVHAHKEVHFEEVDAAAWGEEELHQRLLQDVN